MRQTGLVQGSTEMEGREWTVGGGGGEGAIGRKAGIAHPSNPHEDHLRRWVEEIPGWCHSDGRVTRARSPSPDSQQDPDCASMVTCSHGDL